MKVINCCFMGFFIFLTASCDSPSSEGPNKINPLIGSEENPIIIEKELQFDFFDNDCLKGSNEDAKTDYDFMDNQYRMYSWSCTSGVNSNPFFKSVDLFLKYDHTLSCFKRDNGDEQLIKGVLFNDKNKADCDKAAISVLNPELSAMVLDLDIAVNYNQLESGEDKYTMAPSYTIKNTGTLPLTQYRIKVRAKNITSGESFSTDYYSNKNILLPGDIISNLSSIDSGVDVILGSSWEYTVVILSYYQEVLGTGEKLVTIN